MTRECTRCLFPHPIGEHDEDEEVDYPLTEDTGQTTADLRRIAAKGHDCFAPENEAFTGDAWKIYTFCKICGDVISAS